MPKSQLPDQNETAPSDSGLAATRLNEIIDEIAVLSDEPPAVVALVVNYFMDGFVENLAAGHKLRLGEHGTFRASVNAAGDLRIKHKRADLPPL